MRLLQSYCSFLYFSLYLVIFSSICTEAEYITQPVSVNTSLNSTVTFTCEATGVSFILFFVGETAAAETVNVNRGFTELSQVTINGTIRRQLSVHAREINNNTYVYCFAVPGEVRSDNATLTIQGLLASVADLDYTFINGSSVLLTWTAPYTLDNVPITGYYIVNGLENITTTNKSIILSATNLDPCILNNVSVSPINDAGIGSPNYNISFYYETVPLITPISVVPVIDGQLISLNISIDVNELCKGEYPNSITVSILNTDNAVINNTSIPTQVNDQLMITAVITVPNNLNTFIVNVSFCNLGGELLPVPSFGFVPVTNIASSIDNCSTIDITWTAPTVDDRVPILYYILRIYDAITGSLVDAVSVDDTSYQFVDEDLFRHRYTYVITKVNELGEGISNNGTFSYQRVPKSVNSTTVSRSDYTQTNVIFHFNIPVILECTGEAPENATVTIQCNGTGVVYTNMYLVEEAKQPMNITGSVSVPQYQQCNISIVVSNEAGSSEPFILAFDTDVLPVTTSTSSSTSTVTSSSTSTVTSSSTGTVTLSSSGTVISSPTVSPTSSLSSVLFISITAAAGSVGFVALGLIICCLILVLCSRNRQNEPFTYDGKQPAKSSTSKKETISTGAIGRGPIYSDLGVVAPSTGTKPLQQTEVAPVQYADIETVRPKPKGPPAHQSYDDVVVSTASGATVIGGDTNPPIPDKKSKGAATTGQGGTNGETDAARNLPHHVNDDSHFSSAPSSRPSPLPPHTSVEGKKEGGRESTVATYL